MMRRIALRLPAALPALLLSVCFVAGCGLYTDFKDATRDRQFRRGGSDSGLSKRVVLTPIQNRTGLDLGGYDAMFTTAFSRELAGECDDARLISPRDGDFPVELAVIPEMDSGVTDNQALSRIGRRTGANTVVTTTIFEISGKEERRGVLWFRDTKSFIQFTAGVSAYDMETCAKILDETVQDEIRVDEFTLDLFRREGRIQTEELEEAFREAAEELAESTCEGIEHLPWKGFLIEAGDPVRIAAGSRAGLSEGDLFDVYAPGEEMEGLEGQRFFLPGKKIARVRVVSVEQDAAAVEVVSSKAPLLEGYTVRPAK